MKIDNINGPGKDIIKNAYDRTNDARAESFHRILEQARKEKDDKRLREACEEMEAIFVNMMLKRMRDTVSRGGLIPESAGEEMFRSMLDEELARKVSDGRGIGIAEMLYKQLSQNQEE